MDKFDLETQWKLYLKRVGLVESQMHPTQLEQTKRAFYGACGQLLILLRDDVGEIEQEEEAVKVFDHLLNQVGNFWALQVIRG